MVDRGLEHATFVQTERDGTPVLSVAGELDVANADQFRAELRDTLARSDGSVVVDFADLAFIDSSGIGVLVGASKQAAERGGTVRVEHVDHAPRKVFEITGLADRFGLS
jgi:anti-sigma B factor antagonist